MHTIKLSLFVTFAVVFGMLISCNESIPKTNSVGEESIKDTIQPVTIQIDTNASLHPVCINNKQGYINNEGIIVIQPQFELAYNFCDNRALIVENDKWGYIDKTGKIISKTWFESAEDFSEGMACVKIGGKWGYIDKTGNIVIEPRFDFPGTFKEGLARANIGKEWGYIDKSGEFVIPLQSYFWASDFCDGLAEVSKHVNDDLRSFYIDKTLF